MASSQAVSGAAESEPPDQYLGQYVGQYRGIADPDQLNSVYLDGGVLYEESERRPRQRLIPDPVPGQMATAFGWRLRRRMWCFCATRLGSCLGAAVCAGSRWQDAAGGAARQHDGRDG